MTIGLPKPRLFLPFLVLLPMALSSLGSFGCIPFDLLERNHLSDEKLITNLEADLDKYEKLIQMFKQDQPASVVAPTWISPDNVISTKRWNDYQKLFSDLKLDAGIRSSGTGIWFISTAKGLVTGGSTKGYVYQPENPKPLYPSLDSIPHDLESNITGYRKINDEWYVVFTWDD